MRIHERRIVAQCVLAIVGYTINLAGCAASATLHEDAGSPSPKPLHDARLLQGEVITSDQIATISVQNAYDAVVRLRPTLFATRHFLTSATPVGPCAVIAKGRPELLDVLKLVPAEQVFDIQLIEPRDAVTEYGTACPGGVIKVRLVGQPR
jgi:hypothetical protein